MKVWRTGLMVGIACMSLSLVGPMALAEEAVSATAPARRAAVENPIKAALEKVLADLELTADQKTKIKTIVDDFQSKNEDFRAAHKDEIQPLMKAVMEAKKSGDKAKMKDALEALQAARADAPKLKDLLDKISEVLTPEQKEKFEKLVQDLKDKVQEKRQAAKDGAAAPAK